MKVVDVAVVDEMAAGEVLNPEALAGRQRVIHARRGGYYETLYRTPIERGWGQMVKFDHDFVGREALEKEAANPRRVMVTLEWNSEDVTDVFASRLREGEPYKYMEFPEDRSAVVAEQPYNPALHVAAGTCVMFHQDEVQAGGKEIGVSSGRMYSPYYRGMISLATVNKEDAKIAPFPYIQDGRNEKIDVPGIPSGVPVK